MIEIVTCRLCRISGCVRRPTQAIRRVAGTGWLLEPGKMPTSSRSTCV